MNGLRTALLLALMSAPRLDAQTRWASVTAGGMHTCAVTTAGVAHCWGYNGWGQLGDGSRVDRYVPVAVHTTARFRQLAGGAEYTCGISADGRARCWGRTGALGVYHDRHRDLPVVVGGPRRFRSVAAGAGYSCGVTATGGVYCWGGYWNDEALPHAVDSARRYDSVSVGGGRVCGITPAAEAFCWTYTTDEAPSPRAIDGRFVAVSLRGGTQQRCGIRRDGSAACWSADEPPAAVASTPRWRSLRVGHASVCALATDSLAWCWGDNEWGQLGDGSRTTRQAPVQVAGGHRFAALAVGDQHACGLTAAGALWCWGRNASGELGDGTNTVRETPVRVAEPAPPGAATIAGAPPLAPPPPGRLVLPPGYDSTRSYPLVVFLPATFGSSAGLLFGYTNADTRAPMEQVLQTLQAALASAGANHGREFALLLPVGSGSPEDYGDDQAWAATINRYEAQVKNGLAAYAARYRLDTTRVVLAGFSMGGDLSWALALRNPALFRGAIVMGSRASYRSRARDHALLAQRGTRVVFALADDEDAARLAGARAARDFLQRLGVAHQYREFPRGGHTPAPLPLFAEALEFLLQP